MTTAGISENPLSNTPRVLFVDDDVMLLRSLRRLFRRRLPSWDLAFASSAEAALEQLDDEPADVIVSDLNMGGMDGVRFLRRVKSRHPAAVRVILSGAHETTLCVKSTEVAHQYLAKPVDVLTLGDTLRRLWEQRDLLSDPDLRELVASDNNLPAAPRTYLRLVDAMSDPEVPIERVAEIVGGDVGVSARLIHVASSAFFGRSDPLHSVGDAVVHLGLTLTKTLVLSLEVVRAFESNTPGFAIDTHQQESFRCARLVHHIARGLAPAEDVFLAGLLCDVGKLVLASRCPDLFGRAIQESRASNIPLHRAERELFGATHAEVGGYLLKLWGLPPTVLTAVVNHHTPARFADESFGLPAAVYLSQVLTEAPETPVSDETDAPSTGINRQLLDTLGVSSQLPLWRATARSLGEG